MSRTVFVEIKNAVYQNYLEHVRHMFLESLGVKFTDLSTQGFRAVITRDEFVVYLNLPH